MGKLSLVGKCKWKCQGGILQLYHSFAKEIFRTERKVESQARYQLSAAALCSGELRAAAAACWVPDDLCQPCGRFISISTRGRPVQWSAWGIRHFELLSSAFWLRNDLR